MLDEVINVSKVHVETYRLGTLRYIQPKSVARLFCRAG